MKDIPFHKTKIVATVGPANQSEEMLRECIKLGVDVFRLNFSHGSHEEHKERIDTIRKLNKELGTNVAILQDLQGPKIRVNKVENNGVEVVPGNLIKITTKEVLGTSELVSTGYKSFVKDVKPGDSILLDDGNLEFKVVDKDEAKDEATCEVVHGGILKSNKGINLPDSAVSAPSLTEKDEKDLDFGMSQNTDWVALSFVRRAEDVRYLRSRLEKAGRNTRIISKIERPEAIENIDEIIAESDGIMVARGDLGVEMPMEHVPVMQKSIVKKCNEQAKPVIVATQMLDSMITNPRPTRAEANDVANAVLDGADAVMLSAESAAGKYPLLAIASMGRILKSVETHAESIYYKNFNIDKANPRFDYKFDRLLAGACMLSRDVEAKAITGITRSGITAFVLARHRPKADLFFYTRNPQLLSIMNLLFGVRAFLLEEAENTDETLKKINNHLKQEGYVATGDLVINTLTMPMAKVKHPTNTVQLSEIE